MTYDIPLKSTEHNDHVLLFYRSNNCIVYDDLLRLVWQNHNNIHIKMLSVELLICNKICKTQLHNTKNSLYKAQTLQQTVYWHKLSVWIQCIARLDHPKKRNNFCIMVRCTCVLKHIIHILCIKMTSNSFFWWQQWQTLLTILPNIIVKYLLTD